MLKLHLVGAGTPTPTPKRFGTCYVVEVNSRFFMFDCGPAATYKMVLMGLHPVRIDHLFISHHHFDHNGDLACFLLCRWDQGADRITPLTIWSPPPGAEVINRLIGDEGAYQPDWQARVGHPGSQEIFQARGGRLPRKPPQVSLRELNGGEVVENDDWKLTTTRVRHIEPWMPTLAFRFEVDGKSLVMTSDTGLCPSAVEMARGADVLVCHCWGLQDEMRPAEAGMITGTRDAAKLAAEAGVDRLILSHLGPRLDEASSRARALSEISRIYKGEVIWGQELSVLEL